MLRDRRKANVEYDRLAAVFAALVIVGLVVFLLVRNEPIADPALFFALRLVLGFGAAVLGATIPGFLAVGWSGGGLTVRAGGALALFVLTFAYTPDLLTKQQAPFVRAGNAPAVTIGRDNTNSPIAINSNTSSPTPPPDTPKK
jgi:hypothetical protein